MSEISDPMQIQREQGSKAHRKAEFQEAPGESEADAVREAFAKGAGVQPEQVAGALSAADTTTRANTLCRLQEERGNAYVQRVVSDSRGTPGRLVGESQPEMVQEVQRRKGTGSDLPEGTRQEMETFFGADLAQVRVHSDAESNDLNRELNAAAFTVGNDVFFAQGQYNPTSSEGQGLLAHELMHVGQQTGFGATAQRQAAPEEEEEETVQRQEIPEEEEETVQRQEVPEEEEETV